MRPALMGVLIMLMGALSQALWPLSLHLLAVILAIDLLGIFAFVVVDGIIRDNETEAAFERGIADDLEWWRKQERQLQERYNAAVTHAPLHNDPVTRAFGPASTHTERRANGFEHT